MKKLMRINAVINAQIKYIVCSHIINKKMQIATLNLFSELFPLYFIFFFFQSSFANIYHWEMQDIDI